MEILNYFHDYVIFVLIFILFFVSYIFAWVMSSSYQDKFTFDSHSLEFV